MERNRFVAAASPKNWAARPGRDPAENLRWIEADEGNRTPNLLITNQLLCQLSYVSLHGRKRQTRPEEGK